MRRRKIKKIKKEKKESIPFLFFLLFLFVFFFNRMGKINPELLHAKVSVPAIQKPKTAEQSKIQKYFKKEEGKKKEKETERKPVPVQTPPPPPKTTNGGTSSSLAKQIREDWPVYIKINRENWWGDMKPREQLAVSRLFPFHDGKPPHGPLNLTLAMHSGCYPEYVPTLTRILKGLGITPKAGQLVTARWDC